MRPRTDPIEAAVAMAEASTGTHKPGQAKVALIAARPKRRRFWTAEEDAFLRQNYGRLSETEIGRQLGRTQPAIENHAKRELHLTAPSRDPRVLTGEHVAMGLGVNGKSVHRLCDYGILPFRRQAAARALPGYGRTIRLVDRAAFMRWLLNPANWCYFKPEQVGRMRRRGMRAYTNVYDHAFWEAASKAMRRARRGWGDKWLTPIQAGKALGLKGSAGGHNINMAIHKGTLKATRWGNWWIRRSDLPKTGTIDATGKWVPRILSRQELGKRNINKFWADTYAGRRPWPNIGGKNKKVAEEEKFWKLIAKGTDVLRATAMLKVSSTTGYHWMKRRYGNGWQLKFPFTREARKARFMELVRKGHSTKKAAAKAGVYVESCYRWLQQEWGTDYRKKLKAMRRAA